MFWGVLPKKALEQAEHEGSFVVKDRGEFSATSIDIRVARLFRRRADFKPKIVIDDIVYDPDEMFEEIQPVDGKWILNPNQSYEAETVEEVHKREGLKAVVSSRSSWARYGVYCNADWIDELKISAYEFHGKLRIQMGTCNTSVILRPGDAPAQIRCINQEAFELCGCVIKELGSYAEIAKGAMLDHSGFTLTMDSLVHLYTGGTIDPKEDTGKNFETVDISNGLWLDVGRFYIASSREKVKIPKELIGYVKPHDSYCPGYAFGLGPIGLPGGQWMHANAPWIDPFPRFYGKVTFENWARIKMVIKPGMRLTELQLKPLAAAYEHEEKLDSRYKGQDSATISKGHLDNDKHK
ncbi:2'-deoxycytidine 5'-triphosphate deaminase [Candidatus Woesearchaeota archaeon]|nr:2'-deoxycytidine 5'-triphosphate deaminase [Candidatus Woesearchaeota archaeon]MBW3021634.1 2'-deoxycytidine 5'-triphosphate deaminase [Candidatus Woesearchaeota archaeon]